MVHSTNQLLAGEVDAGRRSEEPPNTRTVWAPHLPGCGDLVVDRKAAVCLSEVGAASLGLSGLSLGHPCSVFHEGRPAS